MGQSVKYLPICTYMTYPKMDLKALRLKMTANDSRHMLRTIHVIFALIGLFISFLPDYREKYCISVIDLDINLEHFGKL